MREPSASVVNTTTGWAGSGGGKVIPHIERDAERAARHRLRKDPRRPALGSQTELLSIRRCGHETATGSRAVRRKNGRCHDRPDARVTGAPEWRLNESLLRHPDAPQIEARGWMVTT